MLVNLRSRYFTFRHGLLDSVSHRIWYEQLISGLVQQGHNLTLLSYAEPKLKLDNYTVIKFQAPDFIEEAIDEMTVKEVGFLDNLRQVWIWQEEVANLDLNSDSMQTILDYPRDKFDLIIYEMLIGYSMQTILDYPRDKFDLIIYEMLIGYSDQMNLLQRAQNWIMYLIQMNLLQRAQNWIMYLIDNYFKWTTLPRLQKLAQDRFGTLPRLQKLAQDRFGKDIVPIYDIEKRIQILLANYDPILDYPIPLPPYIIPVGGLHTRRSTPLEDDLKKIMDNANQGVIYFALGTIVRPSVLPMEKKKMFLDARSDLFRFGNNRDDLVDVPKNVIIRKFFAQNNILAHKNVKLF
ncbi:UDP-glucoronosyl and UDP-glucosyl transferase [Popillia japonica]|uniref:UDP-glucoronosyl and UDP-glucosyl transferase n=1 Tax=Popillia japonica TaxID=7064 RepID=A0AAW1MFV3_POPJA